MKDKQERRALVGRALMLAARQSLFRRRKLPITNLRPLFESLPERFQLLVADAGSVGGLHRRWGRLGRRLATVSFDPLDQRSSESENERVFPILLADRDGEATLKITRRGSMSSTLDPNGSFYAPFWDKDGDSAIVETLTARTTSLDALAAAEDMAPDALKIDVQGGEAAVLAGAVGLLERSILVAEIECSFVARYKGQQTFDQVAAFMRERGFALLDLRRLKRYRYRNGPGVQDPSLGRGMRAGRIVFCDAIFMLEPERLWARIDKAGPAGAELGMKFVVLMLIYGKADLAAATFDRIEAGLSPETREPFAIFFRSLSGGGGWLQQLHHLFDRWAQRV